MYIKDNAYHAVDLNDGYRITKIDGKKKNLDRNLTELKSGTSITFEKDGAEYEGFITVVKAGDRLTYLDDEFVPPLTAEKYATLKSSMTDGHFIMFQQELEGGSFSVPIVISKDTIKDFSGKVISDFRIRITSRGTTNLLRGKTATNR